jgi:hypothetical protein
VDNLIGGHEDAVLHVVELVGSRSGLKLTNRAQMDGPELPDAAAIHRIHGAAASPVLPPSLPVHQSV